MPQTPPEISIIVPVYNVEKYLRQCLDSIESQTFNDWECILVDDGSPDNSGSICEEYAVRDPRFRVIHKENGGLSSARNCGLKVCRGKYIGFIDSDDVAHQTMFERLHELMITHQADVVQVSFELLFTTFAKERHLVDSIVELDRGQVAQELLHGKKIPCYVWNKLFRKDVIDTNFPEGMVFEDVYVMSQWITNIRKMVISPEVLYSYRQRSGSIVNSNYAANRMEYLKSMFQLAYSLRTLEPVNVKGANVYRCIWRSVICASKNIARYVSDYGVRNDAVNQINVFVRDIPLPKIKTVGLKMWWRTRLLRYNPRGYIHMMRLVYSINFHKYKRRHNQFD